MFRIFAFTLAALASMTTLAQTTYDPKIAYTSFEKNADNLYVANADGSKRVSVYKISKARLGEIDMAPVDPLDPTTRKIAFTQAGVLRLLRFKVLPTSITALSVVTLDAVGAPNSGARLDQQRAAKHYQKSSTGYCSNTLSMLTSGKPSTRAWAISRRSNGSP